MVEIKGVDSKFRKVLLIARRAKQLIRGSKKRVDIRSDNPLSIAFEEFEQGKITYDLLVDEEKRQLEAEASAALMAASDPSTRESEEMLATLHSIQDTTETEPDEEEKPAPVTEEADPV
ncbi:MAG TPA: DNA-directed RNA polymerase subunit omega [Candidatus Aminicenantes bacterium]|nr:DNA-directed RNA polymerase subunit omega [Candidatus Aminicenantes bacterium]